MKITYIKLLSNLTKLERYLLIDSSFFESDGKSYKDKIVMIQQLFPIKRKYISRRIEGLKYKLFIYEKAVNTRSALNSAKKKQKQMKQIEVVWE